ncbi:MAG: hypothetical protein GW778_02215 [Alphaproteobacteria bacterium]|nr:hypothetical protein [Alphaproteobacteria bacterium]
MALDDVTTSQELEDTAVFTPNLVLDLLRSIAPDINPPQGIINMLARDANRYQGGDNQTATLEALEADIISAFENSEPPINSPDGPATDANINYVQSTLNLILAGADGAIANISAQNMGGITPQEKEKERAKRVNADAVFSQMMDSALNSAASNAALAAGIPANVYNNLSLYVDRNLPEASRTAIDSIANDVSKGQSIDDEEARTAIDGIVKSVENVPEYYEGLTDEQKSEFLKIKLAEDTAEKMLKDNPNLDPEEAFNQALEKINELEASNPEIFQDLIQTADQRILTLKAEGVATSHTLRTGASLATYGLMSNAKSSDFSDPNNITEGISTLIENPSAQNIDKFIADLDKSIVENGEQGIALRESQEALEAKIENLKNSPYANDGPIRAQIELAEAQIEGMEETFDNLTNMNMLLIEVKVFVDDNKKAILNNNNPNQLMAMALQSPSLREAIDKISGGIGSEKWQAGIEAVAAQIGLSEEYTAKYIQEQIDISNKVTELENSVTYMEEFKAQIEADAAQGINNHFSPEKAAEMIAEREAEIQQLKDELYGSTIHDGLVSEASDAPAAPAPDPAQAFLDNNPELKSYISSLSELPYISEADLLSELEERGLTADQAAQIAEIAETKMAVNVAPKIATPMLENQIDRLSYNSPPPSLSGTYNVAAAENQEPTPQTPAPEVMTPKEIELAAKVETANTPGSPMNMSA